MGAITCIIDETIVDTWNLIHIENQNQKQQRYKIISNKYEKSKIMFLSSFSL